MRGCEVMGARTCSVVKPGDMKTFNVLATAVFLKITRQVKVILPTQLPYTLHLNLNPKPLQPRVLNLYPFPIRVQANHLKD